MSIDLKKAIEEVKEILKGMERTLDRRNPKLIFKKICTMDAIAKENMLKIKTINMSANLDEILYRDMCSDVFKSKSIDLASTGKAFILDIPVKVDRSTYDTLTFEIEFENEVLGGLNDSYNNN